MDPALLLIIVFILAPLIERMLRGAKGAQPPPEQRPGQRIPGPPPPRRTPPAPGGRPPEQVGPRSTERDDAAADMLPDDLWEILTGERRPPRMPAPHEEPAAYEETYSVAEYPEEVESLEEMAAHERPSARDWISPAPEETAVAVPDPYVRPLPQREPPRVVSLEQLEFDERERHDQFHERLETLRKPERVRRRAPNAYRFTSDEDLRRAIIMSEVLGTPRGLE